MKTKLFSRIMVALTAMTLTFSATSCGLGKLADFLDPDNYESGWTEEGNKLIFKGSVVLYDFIYEFTFDRNDICAAASYTVSWSTAQLANAYWDKLDAEEKKLCKKNGNKITHDVSEEFKGTDKSTIREAIFDEM